MTLFHAALGFALAAGFFCGIVAYALVRGGDVVDQMRREEREQWADQDAEWLGATHYGEGR